MGERGYDLDGKIKHLYDWKSDLDMFGQEYNRDPDCFSTRNVKFKLTLFVCR